jgi:hypothetical protein
MNVPEAFRLVALGNRDALEESVRGSAGVSRALIRAILAQYDGNVDGAIRTLKHQLHVAESEDRVFLADMLAPILIMLARRSCGIAASLLKPRISSFTVRAYSAAAVTTAAMAPADVPPMERNRNRFAIAATAAG